jgi:outer membrane protein assembly factor BamD
MTAYSLYQNNEIKKTIIKLQSFLELNPSGELSDYAQYLLGMCYYIQISNQERDPSLSKKSMNYFKILISKYPNSKYAKDAKLKIKYINNSLASNELSIGVFYLKKNSPLAAIKRFKFIIKNYKNTNIIPETLYRLCEALIMIGLEEEAKQSEALLIYNFPQNRWSELSKELFNSNINVIENKTMITSLKNYIKTIFD